MAKHTDGAAAPTMPKTEPQAHISWPGTEEDGPKVKLSGDFASLALGVKARFIVEGTVIGFSMQKYGCSVDLKTKTVRVDGVSPASEDDEGEPMADMVRKMGKGHKKE